MKNNLKIGFTGDFSFSGYFKGAYKREDLIDKNILDFLGNNDYNVLNFESPITASRMTKKKRLAHRSDPESLEFVKKNIKSPVLSLANNHMMDYSRIGMVDTCENLDKEGITFIGAGRNIEEALKYVILGDEVKVGILAIQYKDYKIAGKKYCGPLHYSKEKYIRETINEIKPQVDYTVIVYHGGDEFLHAPMPYFRKQMRGYLDMGADIVVAHHPHVVQGYEYFGKKCIFYSLGNFMFDTDYQRAQEDSTRGVMISLEFTKDGFTFTNKFTEVDRENCRVVPSNNDSYFDDYGTLNYKVLWCKEAARKEDILARAKELKTVELEKRAELKLERKEYIKFLKTKYAIDEYQEEEEESYVDSDEIETDDTSNEESLVSDNTSDNDNDTAETEETVTCENCQEEDLVAVEEPKKKKKKKKTLRKKLRKIKKKYFSRKSYEKMVIKSGAFKAKHFYKNK